MNITACHYNPNLLQCHDSHMNVEVSALIENVKYLHKWFHLVKMPDRAEVVMQLEAGNIVDETKIYLDRRYISSSEAIWRALRFNVHYQSPPVVRLAVHLKDEQFVMLRPYQDPEEALARRKDTTLLAWFEANKIVNNEEGRQLLYADYPMKFRFVKGNGKIQPLPF
jgi:hypothetical protein